MTNLTEMQAVQEAYETLMRVRASLSSGTLAIWRIVDHAAKHLDTRMSELIAAE